MMSHGGQSRVTLWLRTARGKEEYYHALGVTAFSRVNGRNSTGEHKTPLFERLGAPCSGVNIALIAG